MHESEEVWLCISLVPGQCFESFTCTGEFTFSANFVQLRHVARGPSQKAGLSSLRGGTGETVNAFRNSTVGRDGENVSP